MYVKKLVIVLAGLFFPTLSDTRKHEKLNLKCATSLGKHVGSTSNRVRI